MVSVYPVLYFVYILWEISAALVYGKGFHCGAYDRQTVFVDTFPFLSGGIGEAGCGRHTPGSQRHAPVYDRYFYRPDSSCGAGLYPVGPDKVRNGHMVRMADRLDDRDGVFGFLLPWGIQEIEQQKVKVLTIHIGTHKIIIDNTY